MRYGLLIPLLIKWLVISIYKKDKKEVLADDAVDETIVNVPEEVKVCIVCHQLEVMVPQVEVGDTPSLQLVA